MKKMKVAVILIAIFIIITAISVMQCEKDVEAKILDLPPRLQWENDNGYCGEASIQTAALYFGTYISQDLARKIAGAELIVSENDDELLDALKLSYDEWDWEKPTPQYDAYLIWAKKHLSEDHPVIITVYVNGMEDPDYDHIVPAVGYQSPDTDLYHGDDKLIYNDLFEQKPFVQSFHSMWDDRSMKRNDSNYKYCIPKDVDYGVAVTGTVDLNNETVPVSLSVNAWDEPNVTLGESPELLNAAITARSLKPGTEYVLLRYTDYESVPDSDFMNSSADEVARFVAESSSKTLYDTFLSDSLAIYRCVKVVKPEI